MAATCRCIRPACNGEYVAGVRYRAWQPPSCLHPTIRMHAPLVFDILDTWNERSLGGCTLPCAHPGGRSYDTFPVNANEAEGRRMTRFFAMGHTPGRMSPPPDEPSREAPIHARPETSSGRTGDDHSQTRDDGNC